jgi:hypothetical protein
LVFHGVRLCLLTLVAVSLAFLPSSAGAWSYQGYARWQKDIAAFERADRLHSPPPDGILFTGSSVIRKWKTLAQDIGVTNPPPINRGFGGCYIADCTHYADRIIFPYRPRMIFLRAGDNELWAGEPVEEVFADFTQFVAVVHARLPETEIVYITSNPSPARWKQHEREKRLGDRIAAWCRETPGVKCVNTYDLVLGADGKPRRELFVSDGLHLNAAGYRLLAARLRPYLPN